MISTSTRLAKTILSAAIAGSMMTAAPALAREQRDKREYSHKYEQRQTRDHRRDHRRDKRNKHGIGVGEVIVGAAILGGLVALLSDNDGDKRHRERYRRTHSRPHRDYNRHVRPHRDYNRHVRPHRDYNRHVRPHHPSRPAPSYYGNRKKDRHAVRQCTRAVERRGSRWGNANVTNIRHVQRIRSGYQVTGRIAIRSSSYGRSGHHESGYYGAKFKCKIRHGRVNDVVFFNLR